MSLAAMTASVLPLPPVVTVDEVRRLTTVLEALVLDRALLLPVPEDERIALLAAAGRFAHPTVEERERLLRAVRRSRREEKRNKDRSARATTQIRTMRMQTVFVAPPPMALPASNERASEPERLLEKPGRCYVCKAEYRALHFFYDSMCKACGDLNYAKRSQTAPLHGQVALITGARVKIGFQASLMLLRAGATVIATTRFPHDASVRYSKEPDFEQWRHRLQIHGLDLRHAPSVELFAQHIAHTHDRLDILVNNAAQTVRRPPGWYGHLLALEHQSSETLTQPQQLLLERHREAIGALAPGADSASSALAASWQSHDPALGIHSSAALSQVPYSQDADTDLQKLFPEGRLDADLQQVDLREVNTWRLQLAEVATAEMLEVHLVNAVAPFILCAKLKPLMLRKRDGAGHVVNVSAMEGSFSRGTKTDKHPHTNMAKAALNMMTLTAAKDFAESNIYMNAVDTGWVTDEDPAHHAERKQKELDFQPPLDIVDGAARIIDPIFVAVNTQRYTYGVLFKDYAPTQW